MVTFNALGYELAGKVFKAMPEESILYQYSNIGLKPLGEFFSEEFLFKQKTYRGFWVSKYLDTLNNAEVQKMKEFIAEDMAPNGKHIFAPTVQAEYPLEKYDEARRLYVKNMNKGKVLLKI